MHTISRTPARLSLIHICTSTFRTEEKHRIMFEGIACWPYLRATSTGLKLSLIHISTVRAAAKKFGISKSTVHKDLSERLPVYNRTLYLQVKDCLLYTSINQVLDLDISHSLLGMDGATPDTVRTVVSHPQALRQCDEYIPVSYTHLLDR